MSKLLRETIAKSMESNILRETNSSTDSINYGPLLFPLIKKIYPQSLVYQIASVQPTSSPIARVAALISSFTGEASNNENDIHYYNSVIMTFTASADVAFTIGSTYNFGAGGTATVYYKEITSEYSSGGRDFPDTYVHVLGKINSGSASAGNTLNSQTILYSTINRNTIKRVFANYSKGLETNTNAREINFEIKTVAVETESRRIRSKFTQEKLQDLQKMYNEGALELVAEAVGNEIRQEIDREVIDFMKDIATPMPNDIDLTKSLGTTGGDLNGVTYDLYFAIYAAIEEIVKATKRNRTMFILADSSTAAFLAINALHVDLDPEETNPYLIGKIGTYPLFADHYSTEHYILVGYKYDSDTLDDAGLIFAPYTSQIFEAPGTDAPFTQNFMVLNRYGYIRHPQDVGTGSGDSDFFRYIAVNFGTTELPNVSANIRKNY